MAKTRTASRGSHTFSPGRPMSSRCAITCATGRTASTGDCSTRARWTSTRCPHSAAVRLAVETVDKEVLSRRQPNSSAAVSFSACHHLGAENPGCPSAPCTGGESAAPGSPR